MENKKVAIRNAEKSRNSTCALADVIADCVLTFYEKQKTYLEELNINYRQTVVAGIVAEIHHPDSTHELKLLSFGIGTKYISPTSQTSPHSDNIITDSHAEVLACRAFRRFLAEEYQKHLQSLPSLYFSFNASTQKLELHSNLRLHLYTSSQPCGNACIKHWAKGGIGETHPNLSPSSLPQQTHSPFHPHAKKEGQISFLLKTPHSLKPFCDTTTASPWLPRVLQKHLPPSCSPLFPPPWERKPSEGVLSCSDKLFLRNLLGYQGGALYAVYDRLFISSITVGRKFSLAAAERALCCRRAVIRGFPLDAPHPVLMSTSRKSDSSVYAEGTDGEMESASFDVSECVVWWRHETGGTLKRTREETAEDREEERRGEEKNEERRREEKKEERRREEKRGEEARKEEKTRQATVEGRIDLDGGILEIINGLTGYLVGGEESLLTPHSLRECVSMAKSPEYKTLKEIVMNSELMRW